MVRPVDFRSAVRRGRRISTSGAVLHVLDRGTPGPSRFGFIVTKAVGNAVTRNTVRRRLRAVCRELVPVVPEGIDVVIRPLPGSDQLPWSILQSEVSDAVGKAVSKR